MNLKKLLYISSILLIQFLVISILYAGTTGKIAGIIVDKETGEPLPGVNVLIEGTLMGAATDVDGSYTILKVPPGTYALELQYVGYAKTKITDVIVHIDQTSRVDAEMATEALYMESVVVTAKYNQVQVDVSTSTASIKTEQILELPGVNDIEGVLSLQAGMQQDLQIRGSRANESIFLVDGVMMRDPRNNAPIASLPLSAVQEISVQRGGFNAEYGEVQAGIVNVALKEGRKDKYQVSADVRVAPPQRKYFGISPFNPNSFWMRPFLDPQVAWVGTETGWDVYTQNQYPVFKGWNQVSEDLMSDGDPTNDLSPAAAQQQWKWEHRREAPVDQPDYNLDLGMGGPVPFIGKNLGALRFYTSFRRQREMFMVPLSRDDYVQWDYQFQMVSDITPTIKLRFNTMMGKNYGQVRNWPDFRVTQNWTEGYFLRRTYDIAREVTDGGIFSTGFFGNADIDYNTFNLKLTHTLNPTTFYEVSVEYLKRNYNIYAPDRFDTTPKNEIVPGYFIDDRPLGFYPGTLEGIGNPKAVYGFHTARIKDQSNASATTLSGNITSQVNFENQVKAGFEVIFNDLNMKSGLRNTTDENLYSEVNIRHDKPWHFATYLQDKLEIYGFITNLGLRFDYYDANTRWFSGGPYDEYFSSSYDSTADYPTEKTKAQYQLSPRLGVSHPITEKSKLFFNYGHFKQLPYYEALLRTQREATGRMVYSGDPNLLLAKTVAYELGFDYSINNQILFQLAGYYKDITNRPFDVKYNGDVASYYSLTNNAYEDIRGFELTVRKSTGIWWSGFINYTYEARSYGNFGASQLFKKASQQKSFNDITSNFYQTKLIPRPYARLNLSFFSPKDFGFKIGSFYPIGELALNFMGYWQAGNWVTYYKGDLVPDSDILDVEYRYNVQEKDYINFDLRFGKWFNIKQWSLWLYCDVYNVFNIKRLSMDSFDTETNDREFYLASLHLPESDTYNNIPGNDKIGDYRAPGVEYQPIEIRGAVDPATFVGNPGVIYWSRQNGRYYETVGGVTGEVESSKMNKILEDKAYIDMPNKSSFNFLDPRRFTIGIRLSYNF